MGTTVTGDDVEWLTYVEAGTRLGIASDSVKRRAQRQRWRRLPGNDGLARVGVPRDELLQARGDGGGTRTLPFSASPAPVVLPAAALDALAAENRELREDLARSRAEAEGLRTALGALAEAHRGELARLGEAHTGELGRLDAVHQAELERTARGHAAEIARLREAHQADLARSEAEREAAEAAGVQARTQAARFQKAPGLRGKVIRWLAS